jgi:hypothetical protein
MSTACRPPSVRRCNCEPIESAALKYGTPDIRRDLLSVVASKTTVKQFLTYM